MKKLFKLSEVEWLFCALSLAWATIFIPLWPHSFLFLLFFVTYSLVFSINYLKSFSLFFLSSIFYFLWSWANNFIIKLCNISEPINRFTYFLQEKVVKAISVRYKGESGKFIAFLLFNKKDRELNHIINDFRMLSLSHLLVVSGMHLNFVDKGITNLLKKIPYRHFRNLINLTALFIYFWATGLAIPANRVFSEKVISLSKKEELNSSVTNWSQSLWISFIFFPNSIFSYSFLLSYLYALSFRIIDKLEKTKLQKNLIKSCSASFFNFVFFSHLTKKIFPLSGLNQLFLTPIIFFVFIYYLISWPFGFLSPLGIKIYSWLKILVSNLELNKSFIEREEGSYLEPFYLTFGISLFCLLISKYYLLKRERY